MYPFDMGLRGCLVALIALVVVALAGCGSSSGSGSSMNPAQIAPAKSVLYVELTVRPQGAQRSGAEAGLTTLLGYSPDAKIQNAVGGLFKNSGINYSRDVRPWLGQKIGIVLTTFSKSGLGLIAPTSNPKAALATLQRGESKANLSTQSYDGVSYEQGVDQGTPVALGIIGHNAVVASPQAFKAIVDASHGSSLLGQASFTSAFGNLPSSSLVRAYVNGPAAVTALSALPSISAQARRELSTENARGKIPSALAMAVSISAQTIATEVHATAVAGASRSSTADVSHLPGASWLALSTGSGASKTLTSGLGSALTRGLDRSALSHRVNPNALGNLIQRRTGINLQRDLIPALGGVQLAMQGTSLLTFGIGLELHPTDPQAAARLLDDIRGLVMRGHSLKVTGSARSFTITKGGLPIPRIAVANLGREVLATLDEAGFSSLTAPTSTLAGNATFQRARSQLTTGSVVPLFLDFGPLATLLGQTPQFQSQAGDAKALATIRRLDYLVFGVNPAAGEEQLVLGLN
jgi:Protein of unknown function (DUF3352)